MSEAWVVNASPLILFSRIGRLDLSERLTCEILIPNAVIEEVRAGQAKDPSAAVGLQWASRHRVHDAPVMPSIEHWDLGAGESQVLAHSVGRRDGPFSMIERLGVVLQLTVLPLSARSVWFFVQRRNGTSIARAL